MGMLKMLNVVNLKLPLVIYQFTLEHGSFSSMIYDDLSMNHCDFPHFVEQPEGIDVNQNKMGTHKANMWIC